MWDCYWGALQILVFVGFNHEVNRAAHSLARWFMFNSVFGSFDLGNSPSAFANVILEEACQ